MHKRHDDRAGDEAESSTDVCQCVIEKSHDTVSGKGIAEQPDTQGNHRREVGDKRNEWREGEDKLLPIVELLSPQFCSFDHHDGDEADGEGEGKVRKRVGKGGEQLGLIIDVAICLASDEEEIRNTHHTDEESDEDIHEQRNDISGKVTKPSWTMHQAVDLFVCPVDDGFCDIDDAFWLFKGIDILLLEIDDKRKNDDDKHRHHAHEEFGRNHLGKFWI